MTIYFMRLVVELELRSLQHGHVGGNLSALRLISDTPAIATTITNNYFSDPTPEHFTLITPSFI
jgi:hypothetical protein